MTINRIFAVGCILAANLITYGQELESDYDNYGKWEEISISFSGGPGNPKDWVGLYKRGMIAGEESSIAWFYVNGTRVSGEGAKSGVLNFTDGLAEPGIYEARFFENDGYKELAKKTFTVGEFGATLLTDKIDYLPEETITVDFFDSSGSSKDWVGLYSIDMIPGDDESIEWFYVDGTKSGLKEIVNGTIIFPGGTLKEGSYKLIFFENDQYNILYEHTFTVKNKSDSNLKMILAYPKTKDAFDDLLNKVMAYIKADNVEVEFDIVNIKVGPIDAEAGIVLTDNGDYKLLFDNLQSFPEFLTSDTEYICDLTFSNSLNKELTQNLMLRFSVPDYLNIEMPEPIYFENFDKVNEFELPTGWRVESFSDQINSGFIPNDFTSEYYERWVNVSVDRWRGSTFWEEKSTNAFPPVYVNNYLQTINGHCLVADSASRNANFISYLYTGDYDLSKYDNVQVGFYSHYAQNQDSCAYVEYSVDKGVSWLPVVYMLDRDDIVLLENGQVDAISTMNKTQNDIAVGVNSQTSEIFGGSYGDYVASEISQELAPYIRGHVNDDHYESKRFEVFNLQKAAGKKNVRFRFASTGTWSWYWAIDNFGLYAEDNVPVSDRPDGHFGDLELQARGAIVYDNPLGKKEDVHFIEEETGDTFTIDSDHRIINTIQFEYLGALNPFEKNQNGVLRIYANDGEGNIPGSLLFESKLFELQSGHNMVTASDLKIELPKGVNDATWTVEFSGLGNIGKAALLLNDKPKTGQSANTFWVETGEGDEAKWATKNAGEGRGNFVARIAAQIPPPPANLIIKDIVVSKNNLTITWDGAADTELQKTSTLVESNWVDVPNTIGRSSVTIVPDQLNLYFRLVRR